MVHHLVGLPGLLAEERQQARQPRERGVARGRGGDGERARALGLPTTRQTRSASVTFVRRFGSALRLPPRLHTVLCDGVFVHDPRAPEARPRFHRIDVPTDDEVAAMLAKVAARVDPAYATWFVLPGRWG